MLLQVFIGTSSNFVTILTLFVVITMIMILCVSFFKFGNGDGPKLCRLKKVDVSSKFFENMFRSGLTVVSSNDIVTTKIDIKKC